MSNDNYLLLKSIKNDVISEYGETPPHIFVEKIDNALKKHEWMCAQAQSLKMQGDEVGYLSVFPIIVMTML